MRRERRPLPETSAMTMSTMCRRSGRSRSSRRRGPGGLHGCGELDAGDDGRFGQDLALDLRGEGEIALVIVALLADVGGHLAALRGDSGDEETDDQITGEADHVTKDSDVKGVGWRAEELLQEGAEHSESDGDGEAIDQAAERDGEEIEIAERIVFHDDFVSVGDGADGDNDDEVEQSCGAVLCQKEGSLVVLTVLLFFIRAILMVSFA